MALEERKVKIEERKMDLAERKFALDELERKKNLEFMEEQRKDLNRTLERQDQKIQMLLQQNEFFLGFSYADKLLFRHLS